CSRRRFFITSWTVQRNRACVWPRTTTRNHLPRSYHRGFGRSAGAAYYTSTAATGPVEAWYPGSADFHHTWAGRQRHGFLPGRKTDAITAPDPWHAGKRHRWSGGAFWAHRRYGTVLSRCDQGRATPRSLPSQRLFARWSGLTGNGPATDCRRIKS